VSVQDRCMVCANLELAQILFWMHTMVLLGDRAVEARFGAFGDSGNLDTR
jgi:hypothetical protein